MLLGYMKLNVLGLCGGNGVILYPFKKHLIANIEPRSAFLTPENIQWKLNFGEIPLHRDYDFKRYRKWPIDVVIGAPTCGHSSILALSRAKKYGDSKKDLTIALFIDSIKSLKPKFFLFENLTNLFRGFPREEFLAEFSDYKLVIHEGTLANFGNSQIGRKRLIIVGIRKDLKWANRSAFKLPNKEKLHIKTVAELENTLKLYPQEVLFHVREPDEQVVTMEKDFKKLTLKQVRKIWNLPENKGKMSWDARTTGKGRMLTLPGVYRNMEHRYPRTVLKNHRQFDTKGFMMSPRQLAIIQGIPNDFILYYDRSRLGYCLNKARVTVTKTPPMEVPKWFYRRLTKLLMKQKSKKP